MAARLGSWWGWTRAKEDNMLWEDMGNGKMNRLLFPRECVNWFIFEIKFKSVETLFIVYLSSVFIIYYNIAFTCVN